MKQLGRLGVVSIFVLAAYSVPGQIGTAEAQPTENTHGTGEEHSDPVSKPQEKKDTPKPRQDIKPVCDVFYDPPFNCGAKCESQQASVQFIQCSPDEGRPLERKFKALSRALGCQGLWDKGFRPATGARTIYPGDLGIKKEKHEGGKCPQ